MGGEDRFGRLVFSRHAIQRMFERRISAEEVASVVRRGDVIERYDEDQPYPSALLMGYAGSRPLHVVAAFDSTAGATYIVTCYVPDQNEWMEDLKTRRR